MIITKMEYQVDLNKGLTMTPLHQAFMGGDAEAHQFVVRCFRGRNAVSLIGAGITAYFIRADGVTLPIIGSVENGAAVVTLPAACYVQRGRFSLVVKAAMGDTISAILWVEGAVSRSKTDVVMDPAHTIPDLDDLLAKIATMEEATKRAEAAAAIAESKLDKNLGTAQAGKLLFVADDGSVIPLTIGSGLAIQGGALVNTGGGGSGGGESSNDLVFYTADGSVFRTVDDAVFYVKGVK
jgi:hypothetical protein